MRLLRLPLRGRYELVLSQEILTETAQSLLTKESVRSYATYADEDVHGYLAWLLSVAEIVDDIPELSVVANDPKDNMVVATAVAAKAAYLVTGDQTHSCLLKSMMVFRSWRHVTFLTCLKVNREPQQPRCATRHKRRRPSHV